MVLSDLQSLRPRKVVSDLDHVYSEMKRLIMMGEFVPGQKLKLDDLASAFGTSHMPVREALNRLVVARALETVPRKSPRVPEANRKRLRDILDLRVDLECKAAVLSLARNREQLATALLEINRKMDAESAKGAPSAQIYLSLNQRFHFELYRHCGNDELLNLIELLWMRYGPLLNLLRSSKFRLSNHAEHQRMIDSVQQDDAASLQEALCADLISAADAIEKSIEAQDT